MGRIIRIALIQADFPSNRVKTTLEKFISLIETVVSNNIIDFVILPEFFTTGFGYIQEISTVAEPIPGPTLQRLQEIAISLDVAIAGTIPEKRGTTVLNTGFVINRQGTLQGTYQKLHLFPLMQEPKFITPGSKLEIIPLNDPKINVGMIICYDLRFPELTRLLADQGAELIIVPGEWPKSRVEHWLTLLKARAIENQVFVAGCNRTGKDEMNIQYPGASVVIDPLGNLLTPIQEEEGAIITEIDISAIEKVRQRISYLKDRHPLIRKSFQTKTNTKP